MQRRWIHPKLIFSSRLIWPTWAKQVELPIREGFEIDAVTFLPFVLLIFICSNSTRSKTLLFLLLLLSIYYNDDDDDDDDTTTHSDFQSELVS